VKAQIRMALGVGTLAMCLGLQAHVQTQGQTTGASAPAPAGRQGGRANVPSPDPTKPAKLEIAEGTTARYKVREQLAGISFPSDAVGTTTGVTGSVVVNPDGTIDASRSKRTVDLRTLKSDQQMRDVFIQGRTLETEKYASLEFVPSRAV
jgi:hypothetical protein